VALVDHLGTNLVELRDIGMQVLLDLSQSNDCGYELVKRTSGQFLFEILADQLP
jgi:hypothetical protein